MKKQPPVPAFDRRRLLQQVFAEARLSDSEYEEFAALWEVKQYPKKGFLTEMGMVEQYFYVVIDGVQAIYLLDQKGDKCVLGFSYTGSPSGVYDSFLERAPSHYFLEALTDSSLLTLNYDNYQKLFTQFNSFDRWGRIFHQQVLAGRVKREVELLTLSAKERYQLFMRRCPPILQQIPQKYLASYLNMTPETFSRLRATAKY